MSSANTLFSIKKRQTFVCSNIPNSLISFAIFAKSAFSTHLTWSEVFLFLRFLVVVPGFLPCPVPGPFLDTSFPMCRESTALAIRNGPFSTGCFFIISSGSSRNMRGVLSGNTASSGRSSKRSSSAISTAATRAADLLGSGVRAAGPSIRYIFLLANR